MFKKYVEFPELEIKFPTLKQICDLNDVEQAKILFRLANTQYRKALEYFNLEKYLPEHVSIKQDISKLYRFLALMETEKSKIFAISKNSFPLKSDGIFVAQLIPILLK